MVTSKSIILCQAQTDKSAQEVRILRNISTKLVKNEERGKLFGNLLDIGIGTKEIEDFVRNEDGKMKKDTFHC